MTGPAALDVRPLRWWVQYGRGDSAVAAPFPCGVMRVVRVSETEAAAMAAAPCPACQHAGPAYVCARWRRFGAASRVLRWPCQHETGFLMLKVSEQDGPELGPWTPDDPSIGC